MSAPSANSVGNTTTAATATATAAAASAAAAVAAVTTVVDELLDGRMEVDEFIRASLLTPFGENSFLPPLPISGSGRSSSSSSSSRITATTSSSSSSSRSSSRRRNATDGDENINNVSLQKEGVVNSLNPKAAKKVKSPTATSANIKARRAKTTHNTNTAHPITTTTTTTTTTLTPLITTTTSKSNKRSSAIRPGQRRNLSSLCRADTSIDRLPVLPGISADTSSRRRRGSSSDGSDGSGSSSTYIRGSSSSSRNSKRGGASGIISNNNINNNNNKNKSNNNNKNNNNKSKAKRAADPGAGSAPAAALVTAAADGGYISIKQAKEIGGCLESQEDGNSKEIVSESTGTAAAAVSAEKATLSLIPAKESSTAAAATTTTTATATSTATITTEISKTKRESKAGKWLAAVERELRADLAAVEWSRNRRYQRDSNSNPTVITTFTAPAIESVPSTANSSTNDTGVDNYASSPVARLRLAAYRSCLSTIMSRLPDELSALLRTVVSEYEGFLASRHPLDEVLIRNELDKRADINYTISEPPSDTSVTIGVPDARGSFDLSSAVIRSDALKARARALEAEIKQLETEAEEARAQANEYLRQCPTARQSSPVRLYKLSHAHAQSIPRDITSTSVGQYQQDGNKEEEEEEEVVVEEVYASEVEQLHQSIAAMREQIASIQANRSHDCEPVAVTNRLESAIADARASLTHMSKQTDLLRLDISELDLRLSSTGGEQGGEDDQTSILPQAARTEIHKLRSRLKQCRADRAAVEKEKD